VEGGLRDFPVVVLA
jgi:hypothetical protein